jgi:hypothetical protein
MNSYLTSTGSMYALVATSSIVESISANVVETVNVPLEIVAVMPDGLLPTEYLVDTDVDEVTSNGAGLKVGLGFAVGFSDA